MSYVRTRTPVKFAWCEHCRHEQPFVLRKAGLICVMCRKPGGKG